MMDVLLVYKHTVNPLTKIQGYLHSSLSEVKGEGYHDWECNILP